ncbi:MAG: hypothetical protein K0R90_1366 [Oscillospiraceae bacterium]|nr:hypothetical protein [Oscillospiraceae bacterium]
MSEAWKRTKSVYVVHCGWERCNPGHFFGPAVRDHYLFHYVVRGKGKYVVNDKTYEVTSGEGFIIEPDVLTYYEADAQDPWEYYWIGFYGSEAENLMDDCGFHKSGYLIFTYNQDDQVEEILKQASFLCNQGSQNSKQLALIGNLYLFLSLISNPPTEKQDSYVHKITEYIHYHYSYPITVSQIAQYVGLNRSYMCKIFKKELGVSPQEYLINFRISKAKHLLKETNLNVSEVAFSCGFKDISHFSYIFKKRVGQAPAYFK